MRYSIQLKTRRWARVFLVAFLGSAVSAAPIAELPATSSAGQIAQPVEIPGVHNAFRATTNIYSGSQPEGDAAFAAIAKLGVKTIVSVDGSKPDVEGARRHGLRYVHLPYGYDGIPTNRVAELAKLSAHAGPFFVHCHHGKHRGPAAVAVMCLASEGWEPTRAVAWLREAGTADDYPGLYRAAREFTAPTDDQLAAVRELPEIAISSSLVDSMVAIDAHYENLKQSQKVGWQTPPGHADISPAHEATILWEHFREMARNPDTAKLPADYRTKLADSERLALALRALLQSPNETPKIDRAFKAVSQNCLACHQQHRNQ